MNLSIGWYKARNGSKWHVDWAGGVWAVGHSETGGACVWLDTGSVMYVDSEWDLVERLADPPNAPKNKKTEAWGKPSRYVILGLKSVCSRKYHGMPLWALVRDCSTYGSTSSAEICRLAGFDPDQILSSKPLKEIGE